MEAPTSSLTPGQRWVSRTEPELGLGTILEIDERSVVIHFAATEATRRYAGRDAPLRRVRFHAGDEVTDRDGKSFVVESVVEIDGLLLYRGRGRELLETSLSDKSRFNDPSERLINGLTDPTATFDLRQRALAQQARITGCSHRGFVGGRVDLMPHQLYVAQEVAERHAPRVLLADEPGLGKTIEACLILHRLILGGRAERVLIVVPEQLMPQWMVELRRRFNLSFSIYDEDRCLAIEQESPGDNPFTDDQLILCGIETLGNTGRRQQAVDAGWDMVVVDEAHHLHWEPGAPSPQYEIVESLARVSSGLLLITATPEQLGKAGHFARLRLLDPERYPDLDAFLEEPRQHPRVAKIADDLIAARPLDPQSLQTLQSMLSHDAEALAEDLELLRVGDAAAGDRWAKSLLDLYGPGRVMLRNTRSVIGGFPPRIPQLAKLSCDDSATIARVSQELLEELAVGTPGATGSDSELDYDDDPRLQWLLSRLQDHPDDKLLLICTTTAKCLAIEAALRKRASLHAAVFHEALSIVQRDRNAAWFAEPGGAQLLICSEIGSEGRNFQFAHHLVLFDLPLDPDLLEQRIGRLERIGQTHDIHLHVPYLTGSAQEVLVRWLDEGVQAIGRSTSAGSSFLERFRGRVIASVQKAARGELPAAELESLLADTRAYRSEVTDALEQGRDRMIELTSFRPGASDALIAAVRAQDDSPELEAFFLKLMEHFGVYSDEFEPRCHLLNPDVLTVDDFPDLERGETRVSFDRATALARWDIDFLTMDHPLLQRALDTLLLSDTGNSAFALWQDEDSAGMLLEAIYVVETLAPAGLHIERFLETTPMRLVIDHEREERSGEVTPELLQDVLSDADPQWLVENQRAIQRLLPGMLRGVQTLASELLPGRIAEAQRRAGLRPDLARLRMLMRVNKHIRADEVDRAEAQVDLIADHLDGARLRLQALRLIWRGPCENGRPRLG